MSLRILLADDTPGVRQGVKGLLEREGFQVVGEATDGRDTACEIRQVCPWTHLILLTGSTEEHQIVSALRAGIQGYVVKAEAPEDLARAIGEVSRGGIFLSPSASGVLVAVYSLETHCPLRFDPLDPRCALCGFCPFDRSGATGPTPTG